MRNECMRILVLDDDRAITGVIEDVLRPVCALTIANSFDEAAAALCMNHYDLFLCDYMIDGLPSTLFLEAVALRHPSLRCVLMTGSPRHEWNGMLVRGVVVAALSKPFDLNQLRAVIRSNQ